MNSITAVYAIIQNDFETLEQTFERACFDCHSTGVVFPWYYRLPMVKGLIDDDISEAKEHQSVS